MLLTGNKRLGILTLLSILMINIFSLTAWAAPETNKPNPEPPKEEPKFSNFVLFVYIDGIENKFLDESFSPNLKGLADSGIRANALGVLPSTPSSVLASALTGNPPEIHGYLKSGSALKGQTVPDLLESSNRKSVLIDGVGITEGLCNKTDIKVLNKGPIELRNQKIVGKAVEEIKNRQPFFMALVLPGPQIMGNGKNDLEALKKTDEQIGRLFIKLHEFGIYDNSMIIVLGRDAKKTNEDAMLPLIMKGPNFKSGAVLPPVQVIDIAPTLALLTGVKYQRIDEGGLVLWNAIQGGVSGTESYFKGKRVEELSKALIISKISVNKLQDERRLLNEEKLKIKNEKVRIRELVGAKNNKIEKLSLKLILYKVIGFILFIILCTGYIIEYFYLKKKFLLFS